MIARFGERRVGVGAEQHGVGTVDADQPQLAQSLRDGVGIVPHVRRKRHDRVAGPLTDSLDAAAA